MAAPGNMRSAIVTAAVMIVGLLAWVAGISLAGLEGSRGFFGAGPLIADANLILEIFLVAGITYGFLLARRGNIDAHQINQTTWVILNLGLIALVMAGSTEEVKNGKGEGPSGWRIIAAWRPPGPRNHPPPPGLLGVVLTNKILAPRPARAAAEKP